MIGKYVRLIDRCTAHTSHIIGFWQHLTTDKIDGELLQFLNSLIGIMLFTHADEYTVVTDNPRMPDDQPVYFSFDLRTDNRHWFRIECQKASDVFLVHFCYIWLFRVLFHCCAA